VILRAVSSAFGWSLTQVLLSVSWPLCSDEAHGGYLLCSARRTLGGSMPWVRLSKWRDIRAREERVEALLEQWDSDVSAARSDPYRFSGAFEVLGTCAGELHEALDGRFDDDWADLD
jgi:hypothetical protein